MDNLGGIRAPLLIPMPLIKLTTRASHHFKKYFELDIAICHEYLESVRTRQIRATRKSNPDPYLHGL